MESEPKIDTIITIRGCRTRIITRKGAVSYSQNDTVLVIMNGKTEIIDKDAFRRMLEVASNESTYESCGSELADSLLKSIEAN